MIVGDETCPDTGKKHLQGFVHFKKKLRFGQLKKMLPSAHIEAANGSDKENETYCSKEKVYYKEGIATDVNEQGGSNVAAKIEQIVKEGYTNPIRYVRKQEDKTFITTLSQHRVLIQMMIQDKINEENEQKLEKLYENVSWKNWQLKLIEEVNAKPDPRKIIWYHDEAGNTGKSFLAGYLQTKGAVVLTNGKSADLNYIYNGEPIVIFDYTRSMETFVNYGILETFKNGSLCSTKYQGCIKRFPVPHVIVMSNFQPEFNKLSLDRWDVRSFNETDLKYMELPSVDTIELPITQDTTIEEFDEILTNSSLGRFPWNETEDDYDDEDFVTPRPVKRFRLTREDAFLIE